MPRISTRIEDTVPETPDVVRIRYACVVVFEEGENFVWDGRWYRMKEQSEKKFSWRTKDDFRLWYIHLKKENVFVSSRAGISEGVFVWKRAFSHSTFLSFNSSASSSSPFSPSSSPSSPSCYCWSIPLWIYSKSLTYWRQFIRNFPFWLVSTFCLLRFDLHVPEITAPRLSCWSVFLK